MSKMRAKIREKLEKIFGYVGTFYSEGPRPAVGEEVQPTAFTVIRPKPTKSGKVKAEVIKIYTKNLLKREFTEEKIKQRILEELKRLAESEGAPRKD